MYCLRILVINPISLGLAFLLTSLVSVPAQDVLVDTNSVWQFRRGTSEASSPVGDWRELSHGGVGFSNAPAPFWYGDVRNGGTELTDMRTNYTCIFLRRTFVVSDPGAVAYLNLSAYVDDGMVVWINGTEVERVNISAGEPTYETLSATQQPDPAVVIDYTLPSPAGYLVPGTNQLAVQVFNQAETSSDLGFDCSLVASGLDPDIPTVASVVPLPGSAVGLLSELTITFNETVLGVDAADLRINGQPAGSVTASGSDTLFTFQFTQPSPGIVTVDWDAAAGITDTVGNGFNPANVWTYTLTDTVAPEVGGATPVGGAQVSQFTQLEITFDEPVMGVNATDLLVDSLPATSVVGSGAGPYLFQFTQSAAGTIQLAWAVGHGITDLASVPNAFAGGVWNVVLDPGVSPGDVIINEFVAANRSGLLDEDGEAEDWIELYNRGSTAVNLLGWSLTDDPDALDKWMFPSTTLNPGEYLVLFASQKDRPAVGGNKFHTNFKLNAFGESLALYNPESPRVAASVFAPEFAEQRNDYSYGLVNSNEWRYFATPTPGVANGTSSIVGIAPQPHFSVERGFFDAPFNLLLTTALGGATIRYTTDGTEPTAGNGSVYSGSLAITDTAALRAVVFKSDYLPSRTRTHSYLYLDSVLDQPNNPAGFPTTWGTSGSMPGGVVPADYEMDMDPLRVDPNNPGSAIDPVKLQRLKDGMRELPTVSIVMDVADIFESTGMYHSQHVTDKSFVDKPCSVEMVLPDGTTAFTATAGLGMHGNASRQPHKNPKHGFKLAFKGDFGESTLDYALFPDSPAQEFDDLILRPDFGTSWRHWSDSTSSIGNYQRSRGTRTRDAWFKHTLRDMGHLAGHSRNFHLFINGLYWGTYDFTEQPTETFAANYFGGEETDFDIIEAGALRSGSMTAYNQMLGISNLSDDANYELMKQSLDMTEHLDYTLMHLFIGHEDWGGTKNWYAIRKRVSGPNGTFKYLPWDGENLLLDEDVDRPESPGGYGYPSGLHTKLVDNAEYRLDFADRVFKHMIAPGGALTPPANIARWQYWQAILDKPVVAESCRWGDYRRDVHQYQNGSYYLYTRENHWMAENNRLVNSYLPGRNTTVLTQFRRDDLYPDHDAPLYNQQGGRVAPGFQLTLSAPTGTIYYTTNGVDPRVYGSGAISPDAVSYAGPVTLSASLVVRARALNGGSWSALNEAEFAVGELGVPLRISEIMYNPPGGDAYEFIEVLNIGNTPLDVSRFSFQGLTYFFPENTLLQPGATLLLSSDANPTAFQARYPTATVFGTYAGSLSNGGERIAVLDQDGRTVTAVHYDDEDGWPVAADGGGASLEVVDPRGDLSAPANWRASVLANGTPGLPPLAPPALGDVVLNEVMADNLTTVTNAGTVPDWVELHNRSASPVSLNGWSLTDDSDPRQFVFPSGTTIPASGYLVVWCDTIINTPGLHAGFSLGRKGDTVLLYDAMTNRVDAITFGLQITDVAVGRFGNDWQLAVPTPGDTNAPVSLAATSELAINEWLADPAPGGDDWVELYNRSTTAPVSLQGVYLSTSNHVFRLSALSFLPTNGYAQLFADEKSGADHLEFKLPSDGGAVALADATGLELERVTYGSQTEGVSEGSLPDGTAVVETFADSVSPGASNYQLAWSGPVLNEVLARNQRAAVTPWGNYADFVELINPGGSTVNLGGMALGRAPDDNDRWFFPVGTMIGAGQTLLVWCDGSRAPSTDSGSAHNTGFALSGSGGEAVMFNAVGQPVSRVAYGHQLSDLPIGRSSGVWQLLDAATPNAANASPATLGAATALRINEWMADPASGDDWFEIYNTGSQPVEMGGLYLTDHPSSIGLTNTQIVPLSFIDGHKWVKWVADGNLSAGQTHANFRLNALGETLRLYGTTLLAIDVVDFGVQSTNVSQGLLPDGIATVVGFPATPTPEDSNYLPLTNVVINEVLTHTDAPLEDAVELFNPTASPVGMGGWYLSDSQSDLKRYRIPDGTTISADGYRVFYQDQFGPADGETDAPPLFTFNSAHGDSVFLSEADAGGNLTGYRIGLNFDAAANGVSFGRHPTSVGVDFAAMSQHTFGVSNPVDVATFRTGTGAMNAYPLVGPVVINELMYHPAPTGTNDLDVADREYVELHNLTSQPVLLHDAAHPTNVWRLADAVTFEFPPSTVLPAHGYLVVVPFDPVTNTSALALFQSRYGSSGTLVGPYSGQLNNAGESVELYRPDTPQAPPKPDAGYVPYLLVDRVDYSPLMPWPIAADGGGASLQRDISSGYGNDPANWRAEAPSAGRTNSTLVDVAPFITAPPQGLTVAAGGTAVFTVEADGTSPLDYQWLYDGQPLSGQTATTLTLVDVQASDAGDYQVQVTNSFGSVLSAPAAILTVLVPPTIVTPPQSQAAVLGSNALFTVAANGTPPLHYQWRKESSNLSGQNADSLALNNVQLPDAAAYRVVITNVAGAVTSSVAMLTVQSPPIITAHPVGGYALPGGNFGLSVSATGDAPLSYQWRLDGTPLAGATGPTLSLVNIQEADSGSYSAVVSNTVGWGVSQGAVIMVVPAPVLTQPQFAPGGDFTCWLTGQTNLSYVIEVSSNLVSWTELSTVTHTNNPTAIVDPTPGDAHRFYRVRPD